MTNFARDYGRLGLKITRPRNLVYDLFQESLTPLTAEDVHQRLAQEMSLSTVYRIINTFLDHGLLTKDKPLNAEQALYELNRDENKHELICVKCHRNLPLELCPLDAYGHFFEELQTDTNYEILRHKLTLYGYCPECKGKL